MNQRPLDDFRDELDSERRMVPVRRYYFEAPASIAAARLEHEGIRTWITHGNLVTIVPTGRPEVTLNVADRHLNDARRILEHMDAELRAEPDYREADFEDIEFARTVAQQRRPFGSRNGWWIVLLVALGFLYLVYLNFVRWTQLETPARSLGTLEVRGATPADAAATAWNARGPLATSRT